MQNNQISKGAARAQALQLVNYVVCENPNIIAENVAAFIFQRAEMPTSFSADTLPKDLRVLLALLVFAIDGNEEDKKELSKILLQEYPVAILREIPSVLFLKDKVVIRSAEFQSMKEVVERCGIKYAIKRKHSTYSIGELFAMEITPKQGISLPASASAIEEPLDQEVINIKKSKKAK